ncbi:pyrroloquinoline quinone biosynthesis protein PqqF [Pseudomonas sp. NPDC090202]|uniref:pyrroloquinoline quinone biosynthesis protein PqqF n=1 Tax=unclassified Pseudomonas TaxID=196821 RepID=UPI0037F8FDC8
MPATASPRHHSLSLPNGLRVSLYSAPRLKRCAAALRVAAGSHDVDPQWPGLAHFLEHLFFLGTERFPTGEHLMAFVQRHGGQVNASTRERTTDFFFELPQSVFADGLERLCDMLAHPRMALEDQLREREVLHAEFIAWSRDAASRDQLKRLQVLSPRHPLRGFHAGNRFSLPVPRQAFQQALEDFYRRFYQAGQMTLSLSGPQSLDELQALAERFGGCFATGTRVEQTRPPALVERDDSIISTDQTHLLFACEDLPPGHEQAAAFLCTWLNNTQDGGLTAELRRRGLAESLKAEMVYGFAGQVLLEIRVEPGEAIAGKRAPTEKARPPVGVSLLAIASEQTAQRSALLHNWLTFFKPRFHALLAEYARLQQRHLDVSGALSLARHFSETDATPGLSSAAITALDALLDRLIPAHCSPIDDIAWQLPAANPFLLPSAVPATTPTPLPALTFSEALADSDDGTLYLRWTLPSPQPTLAQMLGDSLKPLIADAQEAGVTLTFAAIGSHWQLKLSGLAEPMPAVLNHALQQLTQPTPQTLARYGQASNEPAPIPIRQLLKVLPDHFLNIWPSAETRELASVWAQTRWSGFAIGLNESTRTALCHVGQRIPGQPLDTPGAMSKTTGQRWQSEPSTSAENALLLFCPTPSSTIEDEAIWRLFAQWLQGPFYQRLRVELQLGYAVFSGFRQIDGQSGLLFGVQSPGASVGQLRDHIDEVLHTLPALIEQADLPASVGALLAQLDPNVMDPAQAAEMFWQAHLAGHGADYLPRLRKALAPLQKSTLIHAADRLTGCDRASLHLANRPDPDGSA